MEIIVTEGRRRVGRYI